MECARARLNMESRHILFQDKNKPEDGHNWTWCPNNKLLAEIDGKLDATGITNICGSCGEEVKP